MEQGEGTRTLTSVLNILRRAQVEFFKNGRIFITKNYKQQRSWTIKTILIQYLCLNNYISFIFISHSLPLLNSAITFPNRNKYKGFKHFRLTEKFIRNPRLFPRLYKFIRNSQNTYWRIDCISETDP